ncbi:hypothetical protein BC826DRAFT_972226 [Russula brevipes]|nr:hypothetical protein BC826DRAFT_972226 [Russula brevipes]
MTNIVLIIEFSSLAKDQHESMVTIDPCLGICAYKGRNSEIEAKTLRSIALSQEPESDQNETEATIDADGSSQMMQNFLGVYAGQNRGDLIAKGEELGDGPSWMRRVRGDTPTRCRAHEANKPAPSPRFIVFDYPLGQSGGCCPIRLILHPLHLRHNAHAWPPTQCFFGHPTAASALRMWFPVHEPRIPLVDAFGVVGRLEYHQTFAAGIDRPLGVQSTRHESDLAAQGSYYTL